MKQIYIIIIMLFLFISCKSIEKMAQIKVEYQENINFNEGWIDNNKFVSTSIGYPSGYIRNMEEAKNSAFNAALALSKIKIENAFHKELQNKDDNKYLKDIVEKHIKIEYSDFIDERYYKIKSSVEYDNLLILLREGNTKNILN